MTCVTGTSMNVFTMDRTLEREWDESVKQFLKEAGSRLPVRRRQLNFDNYRYFAAAAEG